MLYEDLPSHSLDKILLSYLDNSSQIDIHVRGYDGNYISKKI